MSLLLTVQINNFKSTSVVAQKPTVPLSYADNAEYSTGSTENYKKERAADPYKEFSSPVVNGLKYFRTSRERNINIFDSKNLAHNEWLYTSSIHSVMFYCSTHKTASFMKSCKQHISFYYLNSPWMDTDAIPKNKSEKYCLEDSGILRGFNTIIEFPDKLS